MEGFVAFTVIVATVWKTVSMVKFIFAKDTNKIVTQLVTYAVGIAGAFLFAASDFAENFKLEGLALADLNTSSLIIFGFALGSTASAAYDALSRNPEPRLLDTPAAPTA